MTAVPNKAIVTLLAIAIFVTFGGIMMILSKLGFGVNLITGAPTVQYGTVNLTVQATVSINMVFANLSFGSGTLDPPTAQTKNTTINSTGNFNNAYNSFIASLSALQYRNDGNVDVNVSFTGTTAGTFLGGTGPAFKINVTNNEAGSCAYLSANYTFTHYNLTADVTATPHTMCNVSNFEDAQDTVNISVWLWIPSDAEVGLKNASLTLTAVAA